MCDICWTNPDGLGEEALNVLREFHKWPPLEFIKDGWTLSDYDAEKQIMRLHKLGDLWLRAPKP